MYSWTSDSGSTVTGDTVLAFETLNSEEWTCTVVATDGINISNAVSLSVTVASLSGEQIFDFTGSVESFIVPNGINLITIEAFGGQGGTGTNGGGGQGGYVLAEGIPVVPGDGYEIRVGGEGQSGNGAVGGYNDGGDGAFGTAAVYTASQ